MEEKLPKQNKLQKLKDYLGIRTTFKLLFSLSVLLTILVGSTFGFVKHQEIQENRSNSQSIVLDEENETEESDTPSETDSEEVGKEESEDDSSPEKEKTTPELVEEQSITVKPKAPATQDSTTEENEETPTEPEPEPEEEPEPPTPESPSAVVAFYADNQSDTDIEDQNHQRVVNYILNSGGNPVFHAGDIMEDGTQDSLNRFNTVTSTLRATRAFYAALGNNDRKVGDSSTPSQLFLDNFVFPNNERWYSVNYGNLHMIILDSAFAASSSTQLSWLSSDLQSSNSQNRITGVMFHHPTFASNISSYLINHGADFVVAGHYHAYSHTVTNGIDHFVLSGQPNIGYMIVRVYSDRAEVTVYNSSNSVIDTVSFNNR